MGWPYEGQQGVLRLGRFNLGDGSQVRFWKDVWLSAQALKDYFPNVYNIVRKKSVTVKDVLSLAPLNVAFRRSLVGVNLQAWHAIVAMVINVQLTNQRDTFIGGYNSMVDFLFIRCIQLL